MKANDVTICDNCKDRIAREKCFVCGKDLCNSCGRNLNIVINSSITSSNDDVFIAREHLRFCAGCKDKLIHLDNENVNVKGITEFVETQIKAGLQLTELKRSKK